MSKKTTEETSANTDVNGTPLTPKKMCGVIMPIANTPGYEPGHWKDVLNILEDALKETEFEAKLVSERIDIGLIHEQIVTNIYENEIVICDVSSKNPNVMFELGMRLAFDKPTIIIKDELTNYSFDIGGILHLEYPSSLRHNRIEKFKSELRKRVIETHKKSVKEKEYSPFLKGFGRHIIAKSMTTSEVSENQYIIEKLEQLERRILSNYENVNQSPKSVIRRKNSTMIQSIQQLSNSTLRDLNGYISLKYNDSYLAHLISSNSSTEERLVLNYDISEIFGLDLSDKVIQDLIKGLIIG